MADTNETQPLNNRLRTGMWWNEHDCERSNLP